MPRTGVILIHGLMGSPREYECLSSTLRQDGFIPRTISLPGHGELRDRPLHDFTAAALVEHCLSEYDRLAGDCDRIFIIGHSLGGICTLLTASERPERLAGIVSLSAPFEHAYSINRPFDLFSIPVDIMLRGLAYAPEQLTGFERPDFHPWMYPRLWEEGNRMLEWIQSRIHRIEAPVLLGHSPYDLTIPYLEMDKIAAQLKSSPRIRRHTFESCGHQIFPETRESQNATELILSFIREEVTLQKEEKPRAS